MKHVIILFVDAVCSSDRARGIEATLWRAECRESCSDGQVEGWCNHVRSANLEIDHLRAKVDGPQQVLVEAMCSYFKARQCPAVAMQLKMIVNDLAAIALEDFASWGSFGLQGLSLVGPAGSKRRRIDSHYKLAVTAPCQAAETDVTRENKDGTILRQWNREVLRWLLASNHLSCNKPWVFSSCFDAGRVGRPAQEILLHHGYLSKSSVGICFPPRVL